MCLAPMCVKASTSACLQCLHDIPFIEFDSYDQFVHLARSTHDAYQEFIVHLERYETVFCLRFPGVVNGDPLSQLKQDSGQLLQQMSTDTKKNHANRFRIRAWARDANHLIVLALQSCMLAYIYSAPTPQLKDLINVLKTQLDLLLGYPDCCWSWHGSGILRDLLKTSFCDRLVMNPYHGSMVTVEMVPIETWNQQKLALMMSRHTRLGKRATIGLVDSEILRHILGMLLREQVDLI